MNLDALEIAAKAHLQAGGSWDGESGAMRTWASLLCERRYKASRDGHDESYTMSEA